MDTVAATHEPSTGMWNRPMGLNRRRDECEGPLGLRDLEAVAARLSIPIRYEKGDMRGGLCRLHGQWQIIMNADLPDDEKADLLADSLATIDLESVYVPPRVRAMLEERRSDRA
jgi:hypothetical protein